MRHQVTGENRQMFPKMKRQANRHSRTMPFCWLAALGAVIAFVHCGLNTPEEIAKGREAVERRRQNRLRENPGATGGRIFGGFRTFVGVYPFAVYMLAKELQEQWECSGSIVAAEWVLTALHCGGYHPWEGVFFAGDVDYTTDRLFTKYNIQIRLLRTATGYQPPTPDDKDHDIMLVRIWRGFTLVVGYVTVIPITQNKSYAPDFQERCTVIGFGQRGKTVNPPTGIQRGASFVMERGGKCGFTGIEENGLCTFDVRKKSVCFGDSGGPILCKDVNVQFGLVVAVLYENCSMKYCGAPAVYNVHVFLGYYRDWIMSVLNPPLPGQRAGGQGMVAAAHILLGGLTLTHLVSPLNSRLVA